VLVGASRGERWYQSRTPRETWKMRGIRDTTPTLFVANKRKHKYNSKRGKRKGPRRPRFNLPDLEQ
jgi:hypothetical protein